MEKGYRRCRICNSVNSPDLADGYDYEHLEFSNFRPTTFHTEGLDFYCDDCQQSHRDVMTEFDMEDQADDSFEDYEDEQD